MYSEKYVNELELYTVALSERVDDLEKHVGNLNNEIQELRELVEELQDDLSS